MSTPDEPQVVHIRVIAVPKARQGVVVPMRRRPKTRVTRLLEGAVGALLGLGAFAIVYLALSVAENGFWLAGIVVLAVVAGVCAALLHETKGGHP
jgi:hypothetical protein